MGLPRERLDLGNSIWFDNRPWTIVGQFTAAGTVMDAEIWCAGHYVDQSDLGPEVVASSNLTTWDPHWRTIIDAWWAYTVDGVPYDAPTEKVDFSASEGGNDISPINDMGGAIPQEVIDQVMEVRQQILDGDLVVELRTE
jgi:basic membrane lipoprotein Med (substrate-binding protein (PBP1-ABC) superfamily)